MQDFPPGVGRNKLFHALDKALMLPPVSFAFLMVVDCMTTLLSGRCLARCKTQD